MFVEIVASSMQGSKGRQHLELHSEESHSLLGLHKTKTDAVDSANNWQPINAGSGMDPGRTINDGLIGNRIGGHKLRG